MAVHNTIYKLLPSDCLYLIPFDML